MAKTFHYFPGSNTAAGFVNLFDHILPAERARRIYRVKGGPGVGKSSLMSAVAKEMEEKGRDVEYFHCSSDPDGLDAVAFPGLGVAMMDATAPHVMDPKIPGAQDTLISLGDYLDEKALSEKLEEIKEIMAKMSPCFLQAYCYLEAARQVELAQATALGVTLPPWETGELAKELVEKYLSDKNGAGEVRHLFTEAFTPKGFVSHLGGLHANRVVALTAPFGVSCDPLLKSLAQAGQGHKVTCLHDPLDARRLSHVFFPEENLLFTTARQGKVEENVVLKEALHLSLPENQPSFDKNAFELLVQRAGESLAQAKVHHDELEKHYIRHMDFSGWESTKERILAQIKAL